MNLRHPAALCFTLLGLTLVGCDSVLVTQTFDEDIAAESDELGGSLPELELGFALPPRGLLRTNAPAIIGVAGGFPFAQDCAPDQVLAGIEGTAGYLLDTVVPICVSVDGDGKWSDEPARTGQPYGGTGGSEYRQICPADSAVVGFNSGLSGQLVGSLSVECARLQSTASTDAVTQFLPKVGLGPSDSRYGCSSGAVATGLFGRAGALINELGLQCIEAPTKTGRWTNVLNWPLIAIHSVMAPDGRVFTYGSTLAGEQGAQFHYDIWDPAAGTDPQSHLTLVNTLEVDSFCSAALVLPESANILMPGGDGRPQGRMSSGITDAPMFNTNTNSLSRAADMQYGRWYPTATTLGNGEILVAGGVDSAQRHAVIPEVYSPESDQWRPLQGANTAENDYWYPRHWVAPDGRVFGISDLNMYYIDTTGQGSLQKAGQISDLTYGKASTAVMYQPGKILQVGGGLADGKGAIVIDINGFTPRVKTVASLAQSRTMWAESVVLPDGKVLIMGGALRDDDVSTASLGTEMWDPDTEQWTMLASSELPRLYHSTAILLKDGRVLLAGGGAPGPLINRNAEIFSPPYLFDDSGNLAQRPTITSAPKFATHAQSITLTHGGGAPIERATLIKTSAVTHSFNMEQRFFDLAMSSSGNTVTVDLPESPNSATPGNYLVYLIDGNGVPSEGHILTIGDRPAPNVNPVPVEAPTEPAPLPPTQDVNLLVNGGFEQGKSNWLDCAANDLTKTSITAADGNAALQISNGGCLYQEFSVTAGMNYALECKVRNNYLSYASMSTLIFDNNYNELESSTVPLTSDKYSSFRTTVTAPEGSTAGSVTLYAEGTGLFDQCSIVTVDDSEIEPLVPENSTDGSNLLVNGDFEQGKTNWLDCASSSLNRPMANEHNGTAALQVENAGCVYQEFTVIPGKQYNLSCKAISEGTRYSSISLQISDQSYIELAGTDIPVASNSYNDYSVSLVAPNDAVFSAVTLYSEDTAIFDECTVNATN